MEKDKKKYVVLFTSADPFVASYRTTDYSQTRWRIYGGLLELSVASALVRCGSKKGVDLLTDYLDDIHSDFRRFANEELESVLGRNFRYSGSQYRKGVGFALTIRPLRREVER